MVLLFGILQTLFVTFPVCPLDTFFFSVVTGRRLLEPPKKQKDSFILAFGLYGAVGFQLATAVVGGLVVGSWLDNKFETKPWLALAGLLLGAVGGFYNLIKILNWRKTKWPEN